MSALLARAAVAPLLGAADLGAEQVSQVLLGEVADVLAAEDEWRRVRLRRDGYEGWLHQGYTREVADDEAARWQEEAWWSEGAIAETPEGPVALPPAARVLALDADVVILPDGRRGRVLPGRVRPRGAAATAARRQPPERWALEHFCGAPYLWGGVSPWGVDCSGLVQITMLLRGIRLPRDTVQQAECGEPVAKEAIRPSDLLFFSEPGHGVTHVAFAAAGDALVHSTVACGGVVREPWAPGTRAAPLRDRLITVRRLPAGDPTPS